MQDTKLEKAIKLFEAVNANYATPEDIAGIVKSLVDAISGIKKSLDASIKSGDADLNTKVSGCISQIKGMESSLQQLFSDNEKKTLDTFRTELGNEVGKVQKLINTLPPAFDPTELQNQIDVLMAYESKETEAIGVRDALETLGGEDRLDASAIKNLPMLVEKIQTGLPAGPQALWALTDVDVAGIAAGQHLEWDGIKWIAVTPAGSTGTPVWGEDLTSQGPGTVYTLAHTPVSGTVRLFRGGAYQQAGAGGDYTISGATITFGTITQTSEVILADYSY